MDVTSALKQGLESSPRHLPVWYRYDKQGSIYNDRCLSDNKYYYFYSSEVAVLKEKCQELVGQVPTPCVLVEMGSGNSEKSRMIIDILLSKQQNLTYMPVDISEEFLEETAHALAEDYGECLNVRPIPGDYSVGIAKIRDVQEPKLILWLGGGFQNQPYDVQVKRIKCLAEAMPDRDRLVIALDITQDSQAVENAYLDPSGVSAPLYLNGFWRLNREQGANVDTNNFQLEAKFERRLEDDNLSRVVMKAVAKVPQTIDIRNLNLSVSLEKGDYIVMHEGEGLSCKYTKSQIRTLVEKGSLRLHNFWADRDQHVALSCIGK